MTENKLPEGVGKKIVEALKKQSEIEVQPIPETMNEELIEDLITEEVNDVFVEEEEALSSKHEQENSAYQYQTPPVAPQQSQQAQRQFYSEPVYQEQAPAFYNQEMSYNIPSQKYREPQMAMNYEYNEPVYQEQAQPTYPRAKEFTIPSNVAVLKRLISQLPQGVSKQTGAQIIRQTMEALGISMSTVLNEAQNFQDGLNNSVRECVSTIQEYKNNIKNLEKQVSDYQKQSAQVNDLISLFIMTDK